MVVSLAHHTLRGSLQVTHRLMYFVKSPLKIARWCHPNYVETRHDGLFPSVIMGLTPGWSLTKMLEISVIWVGTWFLFSFFFNLWCIVEVILMKAKRFSNFHIKRERFPSTLSPGRGGTTARTRMSRVPGMKLESGSRTGQTQDVHSTNTNPGMLLPFYTRHSLPNCNDRS